MRKRKSIFYQLNFLDSLTGSIYTTRYKRVFNWVYMNKINKNIIAIWLAVGAVIFMAAVCVYLLIGTLISSKIYPVFHYYVPFSFLVQGMVMSMAASGMWLLLFGNKKPLPVSVRYLIAIVILLVLYFISVRIPAINSLVGHLRWLWSCCIAVLALGVPFSIVKEKNNNTEYKQGS